MLLSDIISHKLKFTKAILTPIAALALYGSSLAQDENIVPDQQDLQVPEITEFSAPGASQDVIIANIGGRPLCRCTLKYKDVEIQANLMFDVSLTVPFQIHELSLNAFELTAQTAVGQKLDIEFKNGVKLTGVPIEGGKYPVLVDHTRIFAPDLNEVPVVGFIGPAAFSSNVIELDVAKGLLRTMGLASDEARNAEIQYSLMSCGIVVNGSGPAGTPLKAALSNQIYDSGLTLPILKEARDSNAIPNVLNVAKIDWATRNAIRFAPTDETWPASVNAVIGADALARSIVTIWPKRKTIAIRPSSQSLASEEEQKYFFALADRDSDAVAKFISTSPRRRLLDDACLNLWELRFSNSENSLADVKKALDTIADNYRPERRSQKLLDIADALETFKHQHREALIEHALALSVRESDKALEQTAIHDVHVRIGRRALASGNLPQARRHLLSAAFGMPKDAECNFWLGEYYRQKGKSRRAWSRYFQVLLDESLEDDDPFRADAIKRIGELNRDPKFRETFNMIEAEEYMDGRLAISEFHAQSRHRFMKQRFPHHVHMVELFIDPTSELAGGMELAFQALNEFYQGDLTLVSYHIGGPLASEAARKRLAFYQKENAPLIVIDGKPMFEIVFGKGEKPNEDAALHYPSLRAETLAEKAPESTDWNIAWTLSNDPTSMKLKASIKDGTETDDLRFSVLLCENSVMAIEANGVFFHHNVVRDQLTPVAGIELAKVVGKPFEVEIDVLKLRQRLTAALPAPYHSQSKKTPLFIDSDQLFAVGIIHRGKDSRILSTSTFSIPTNTNNKKQTK